MASLERVKITPLVPVFSDRGFNINWEVNQNGKTHSNVPHIFFSDGTPWLEVNAYALERLNSPHGSNPKTVTSCLSHLKAYAEWTEHTGVDWKHFPLIKHERCIYRFRGFLVEQRNKGIIRPSTAAARMAAVISFYRWAHLNKLLDASTLWTNLNKVVHFNTTEGFTRTVNVLSSELSIPNRKNSSNSLEGGLLPLSDINRDQLLDFLNSYENTELNLMCKIGFFSGARSETIRTLRVESLENAIEDPFAPNMKRVLVGPGTLIRTKYDVQGTLMMPNHLIEELKGYAYSARRLARASKASKLDKSLLFLSQQGNPYLEATFTKLISNLRKDLIGHGLLQFENFKFHQTRATFGTTLMRIALSELPDKLDAILFVRDAMLHKHESTTWKYVKFIEATPIKEWLSNEFFRVFIGNYKDADRLIQEVTYSGNTRPKHTHS